MVSVDNSFLVFFVLALIYGALSFFCIVRTFKLHKFTSEWVHSKVFYLTLVLQCILRTAAFLYIFIQWEMMTADMLFLLLSIPDCMFIFTYLMLFWEMLTVFFYSPFDQILSTSLLSRLSKKNDTYGKIGLSVRVMISACLIAQIALYLCVLIEELHKQVVMTELGLVNLGLPTIVLGVMLFLHIRHSGSPTRSEIWRKKLHKMNQVTIIWSLGRYFRGVVSLINYYDDNDVTFILTEGSSTDLLSVLLLIAYIIGSEVICMLFVLDYSFMMIFVFINEDGQMPRSEPIDPTVVEERPKPDTTEYLSNRQFTQRITRYQEVETKDVVIKEHLKTKKGSLGQLSIGIYNDCEVIVRRIIFPRLSGYVVEELREEIDSLKQHVIPNLLPLYGTTIEIPEISFITPYMQRGSLYDALHVSGLSMEYQERLAIACDVANCMKILHDQGRCHGHLSSHNILLDENLSAYISDLGVTKLKKFAGLMIGYTNKTAWSSPELLLERFSSAVGVTEADDVYSFGVVLWEVISKQEPFPGFSRQKLIQTVAKENYRPQIPSDLDHEITRLLQSCWNTDPANRPSFSLICDTLSASFTIN